jgi:hypothetical protein
VRRVVVGLPRGIVGVRCVVMGNVSRVRGDEVELDLFCFPRKWVEGAARLRWLRGRAW